jgi:hypothetical protein
MLVVSMYVPILMLSTYAVFHNYGHVVTLGYRYPIIPIKRYSFWLGLYLPVEAGLQPSMKWALRSPRVPEPQLGSHAATYAQTRGPDSTTSTSLWDRLPSRHMFPDLGWAPVQPHVPKPGAKLHQLCPPVGQAPEPPRVFEPGAGSCATMSSLHPAISSPPSQAAMCPQTRSELGSLLGIIDDWID